MYKHVQKFPLFHNNRRIGEKFKRDSYENVSFNFLFEYIRFAAISNDICLCANKQPAQELNEDECTLPCKSNREQICGGFGKQSFYSTGINGK